MTNGHCVSGLNVGDVWSNKKEKKSVKVYNDQMDEYTLNLTKIIYATMVDTDVAFFETDRSYDEILKKTKIEAFTLDDQIVSVGTNISVVSGYWKEVTSCKAEAIVPMLIENNWRWKNSIRYSKSCMTRGGFSGSPVIENNTRTIVGIHNTGNNGELDCSDMNPCEQDLNGRLIFRELYRRYAQQVHQFYGCIDQNDDFDFTLPTCTVPKPKTI